jgi:tetratricopeptide (TPR) repeat protein
MRSITTLRSTVLLIVVAVLSIAAVLLAIPRGIAQEMTKEQEAAMTEIFTASGEAGAIFKAGRFAEAEAIFRDVLAKTEEHFPGEALMRASALHNVAAAAAEQGRLAQALPMAEEAFQLRREAGAGPFALGSSQSLLASILREQGRRADATALMREAVVAVADDPNAPGDAIIADFAQFLGMLAEDGRIEEAERVAEQLLGFVEQVGEAEHVDIYWAVARLRSAEGRFAEADRNYRLAYAALAKAFPDDLTRRAILISNIASVLRQQFRQGDAEQLFRRAAEDLEKLYPEGHPALAAALDGLALSIAEQNRPGEAWPIGRKALDMRLALLPGDHPLIATSLINLGLALLRDGQFEPARDAFQTAVDRRQEAGDEVGAARAAVNLAVAQHALGDPGGGVDSLENARSVFAEALPAGHPVATTAAIDEAWLLLALGDKEKALAVAREAAEALIAARAVASAESDATPVDEDKRRIVVKVAAAWEVAGAR